jgi:hypothetical protein
MSNIDTIWLEVLVRCRDRIGVFPRVVIREDASLRTKPRHFAAVSTWSSLHEEGPVVLYIHPELEHQKLSRLRGILAHEAGHIAIDHKLVTEKELPGLKKLDSEVQADVAATYATGWKIYYDKSLVQLAGPGARGSWPRPDGLR